MRINFLIAVIAMISIPFLGVIVRVLWNIPLTEMREAMLIGAVGVAFCYALFKAGER